MSLYTPVDYLESAYHALLRHTGSLAPSSQTCPAAYTEHLPRGDHAAAAVTTGGDKICRAYNLLLTER